MAARKRKDLNNQTPPLHEHTETGHFARSSIVKQLLSMHSPGYLDLREASCKLIGYGIRQIASCNSLLAGTFTSYVSNFFCYVRTNFLRGQLEHQYQVAITLFYITKISILIRILEF